MGDFYSTLRLFSSVIEPRPSYYVAVNPFSYSKLPLAGKILVPMLSLIIGIGAIGFFSIGYLVTQERTKELKRETTNTTDHIVREFEHYLKSLRLKAAGMGNKSELPIAVMQQDPQTLLQMLLPLQTSLELDLLKIVDQQDTVLVDLRSSALGQMPLSDSDIIQAGHSGLVFSNIIVAPDSTPVMVEVTSIKSRESVIGSVIVGHALTPAVMNAIVGDRRQDIVLMRSSDVLISTSSIAMSMDEVDRIPENTTQLIQIANQPFLAQRVPLAQIVDDQFHLLVLTPLALFYQSQRQIWVIITSVVLMGSAIFIVLGLGVTRLMTRRLERLTQATQALAEGSLTTRIPVDSQDEVAILAQSFNDMAEQLAQRDLKIQSQVEDLENLVKELQQMPQRVHTEKMAGLGQMVAGVAHEINNPVNFIYGNVPLAQEDVYGLLKLVRLYQKYLPEPPHEIKDQALALDIDFVAEDLPKLLASMWSGAERIQKIVLSLRNFSRKDESDFKEIDLRDGLENTLVLLGHRLKAQPHRLAIAVIKEYAPLPLIPCYAGELNQVFMNVLGNAIDALEADMLQHSSADSEVDPSHPDPPSPQIHIQTEPMDEDWVTIRIADNGPGIPKEIRSKLFDPFFTTKDVGQGTGLGLSISYQIIVEKHGGTLWCDSVLGQGTEFVIQLPIRQKRLKS